jgi:WD40 repeat protein
VNSIHQPSFCLACGAEVSPRTFEGFCPSCTARLTFDLRAEPSRQATAGVAVDFGDYELLEEIGRGGMGVVYRAHQRSLNRIVALKMILAGRFAGPTDVQRFQAEAVTAAHLRHPNIVAVHEVGEREGHHFFSMDYVEGKDLAELAGGQPLPARRAARYLRLIARAIQHAHDQGIIHRDLKPSNVLIDANDQPKVTDFGLAKRSAIDSDLTLTGQVLGSPNFSPPEQARGHSKRVESASDIYSMGAILYFLVTGRPPFLAQSLEQTLHHVLNTEPAAPSLLNPAIPRDLETICLKCLEKEPKRRYQTAQELVDDLGRFENDEPISVRPVSVPEKVWRWCRRNRTLAGLGIAVALLFLAIAVGAPLALVRINESRRQAQKEATAARQSLYAADMLLAQQSYEAGNVQRAIDLLVKHRPKTGEQDLREFAWSRLWHLCQTGDALTTVGGHTGAVHQVAWSTNGLLATAGLDGTVQVYDAARGLITLSFDAEEPIRAVACSHDGTILATGSDQGRTQLWTVNPPRGTRSQTFRGRIETLALSPDGTMLAISVLGEGLKIWLLMSDQILSPFPDSDVAAIRLAFSGDGRFLVAGGKAMPVRIWTVADFCEMKSLEKPHSGFSTGVAFSPDGQILATASWDTTIKLWNFKSHRLLATLKGHLSHVWDLDISPDGRMLASGSEDGTIKLWRLDGEWATERTMERTLRGHTAPVYSVRFSADGETLASGSADHTVKLWRLDAAESPDVLSGHDDWVYSVALASDGRHLATGSFDGTIRLWDLVTRSCRTIKDAHRNNVFGVAFLADGRSLVSCDAVWRVNAQRDFTTPGELKLWDGVTGTLLANPAEFTTGVRAIAVSPNGALLATGDNDGAVRLWNLKSLPPAPIRSVDGRHVISGNRERPGQIGRLQFSPDGSRLAILRRVHSAEVWNVDPLQLLVSFSDGQHWNYAIALSPDGRWLIGGHEEIKIWEIETGKMVASLKGHKAAIMCAAFSPDGKTLATGSVDRSVKLWNLLIQHEVATLTGHQGPVSDVAFSPDGSLLVSASEDKTARIWRAAPTIPVE